MYAASYRSSPDRRRRAISLALTIVAHILIVLLLLLLPNSPLTRMGPSTALTTFDVSSSGSPSPSKAQAKKQAAAAPRGGAPEVKPQPTPPQDQPLPPPPPEVVPDNMLIMDRASFAATDVSKIKGKKSARELAAAGDASGDSGDAGAGDDTPGAGKGPGGQRLYAAEWYREPVASQTSPYMPKEIREGSWAEIACRTAPDYRVEDCQQIGESPVGAGLARGLREAAWQFRVRPPRINGKPMIGTWVRIHYDFTERAAR
ncbi:hypothetical protein DM480_09225 [Sphingomonas sp. FARSPH]|nr:hypothetical protein DM480_09225 [Sphingomonas sp. FARSPH]